MSEPKPPALRERNKQDKLRRIREAARALFLTQGFEATTTRQVAEQAGVGSGTLFLYARDKQDLVFLIFREEVGGVIEQAFAAPPDPRAPLSRQVCQVFAGFFAHYHKSPELSRLFVKELAFLRGDKQVEYAGLTVGFLGRLAGLVEAAQARGEVRADVAPPLVASNFFALYLYHLLRWLGLGAAEPTAALEGLHQALRMQIEGLVPRAAG